MFGCAFERSKSTFNTKKKIRLKKKTSFIKKFESIFKGLKSKKKLPKPTFDKNLI